VPKWSSYITRFLILMMLAILALTVLFYGLSTYFFNDYYTAANYSSLAERVQAAGDMLYRYQQGKIDRNELKQAVNPALNAEGAFYLLADEHGKVIAYTERAAPYFAGDVLPEMLSFLKNDGAVILPHPQSGAIMMLMGERVEGGYVLAGRPMQMVSSAAVSYRTRLLISSLSALVLVLLICSFTARRVARPARMITEMASRLIEGEQVLLPEDLPGQEMREIARAMNHMSRTVARAFQELRYDKETMSLILEGLTEGILAVERDGSILHENTAARQLLGDIGSPARQTVLTALREEKEADAWDGKIAVDDGILYYVISRLPAQDGKRRGTVALIRDITQQERLDRTRHDYVANISHELRTPLSSIRGLGEGLRDGLVTEEKDRQRYYTIIVDEVTRLSRLVNDLLELSSLQSNPAAFETERIDPNELVCELEDLNARLFAEKQIAFERVLPDKPLPDICFNEDRLSQVLTIFLDNARKYTPAGGNVWIGAEEAACGVRFYVKDTGIGMDAETRRLAFDRFHQAEKGRSDQGSGLGLSIAKEILQKMHVNVQVESEVGKGSEFSFVIPTARNSCISPEE